MKKYSILIVCLLLLLACVLSGCNFSGYDWIDTNYHFDRAIIALPDGTNMEIKVEKWTDAEDGEQLTITAKDGTRYLTSSFNCILIEDN